jgi:hypothetical protein
VLVVVAGLALLAGQAALAVVVRVVQTGKMEQTELLIRAVVVVAVELLVPPETLAALAAQA